MSVAVLHSGRQVDVASPHPSMFQLRDIGAQLAKQCMFAGASHLFYSRAQHGLIVAEQMNSLEGPLAAIYGLLDNAHFVVETSDNLTRERISRAIHEALDIDWPAPPEIAKALVSVLQRVELAEITQLVTGWEERATKLLRDRVIPLRAVIRPLHWEKAMDRWVSDMRGYAVSANLPHLPAFGDML